MPANEVLDLRDLEDVRIAIDHAYGDFKAKTRYQRKSLKRVIENISDFQIKATTLPRHQNPSLDPTSLNMVQRIYQLSVERPNGFVETMRQTAINLKEYVESLYLTKSVELEAWCPTLPNHKPFDEDSDYISNDSSSVPSPSDLSTEPEPDVNDGLEEASMDDEAAIFTSANYPFTDFPMTGDLVAEEIEDLVLRNNNESSLGFAKVQSHKGSVTADAEKDPDDMDFDEHGQGNQDPISTSPNHRLPDFPMTGDLFADEIEDLMLGNNNWSSSGFAKVQPHMGSVTVDAGKYPDDMDFDEHGQGNQDPISTSPNHRLPDFRMTGNLFAEEIEDLMLGNNNWSSSGFAKVQPHKGSVTVDAGKDPNDMDFDEHGQGNQDPNIPDLDDEWV